MATDRAAPARRPYRSPRREQQAAEIHLERTIAASPERVFDWMLDPTNLTVSPVIRKAGWAKSCAR
jgi:hypothetical protein